MPWVLLFLVVSILANALPIDAEGPAPRDLRNLLDSDRLEHFLSGNWGWFVGPTISYRVMTELRLTAAGGYRTSTASNSIGSGYAKLDFVYLVP